MTITLDWWFWPMLLCVIGVVVAIVDAAWDSANGGGDYSSIGQGCLGACICVLCWILALGIIVGRRLA